MDTSDEKRPLVVNPSVASHVHPTGNSVVDEKQVSLLEGHEVVDEEASGQGKGGENSHVSTGEHKGKKRFIQLKEGVSWINASNIFFTYFVGISQLVFFDISLVYLLKSEDYFNIEESRISKLSADVVFYSQPFTLIFDVIIGYMHDKIGRRWTCFISTMVGVLAFAILPFIRTVYPGLLIIRIMLNFSLKGPIIAPLSADYISADTRGKAVAFTGLGAGFGAIFGVFVLFSLSKRTTYEISFFITAG